VFGDRLDDEVAPAERIEVVHNIETRQCRIARAGRDHVLLGQLAERLLDRRLPLVARRSERLVRDGVVTRCRTRLRDTAAHEPEAEYADPADLPRFAAHGSGRCRLRRTSSTSSVTIPGCFGGSWRCGARPRASR